MGSPRQRRFDWAVTIFDRLPAKRTAVATVLAAITVVGSAQVASQEPDEPKVPDAGLIHVAEADPDEPARLVVTAPAADLERLRQLDGVSAAHVLGDDLIAVTTDHSPDEFTALSGSPSEPDAIATIGGLGHGLDDELADRQWPIYNNGQKVNNLAGVADADTDAPAALSTGILGAGIVVAVIDTGVDATHPDLADSIWRNTDEICANNIDDDNNGYVDDCAGWDFASGDNNPSDLGQHFHGTHVASTIAAQRNNIGISGIAPEAKIMSLKVGNGATFYASAAAEAIRYAVDNGAKIINASFGSTSASSSMKAAIDYAEANGVLVVAAAGNDGINLNTSPRYPASWTNSNIITVANSDQSDGLHPSSNFSTTVVDIAAPGTNIIGANVGGSYTFASGTSMAAPHVSGAAALLLSTQSLTPAQVRSVLMASSDRLTTITARVAAGRLNIAAALGLPDPDDGDASSSVDAPSATSARISFDGFVGANDTTPIDASITYTAPTIDPAGPYRVEATLLSIDNTVAALQGFSLESNNTIVTTSALGAWDLIAAQAPEAYDDPTTVPLSMSLPVGRYGIIINTVAAEDPELLYDDAQYLAFDVVSANDGTTASTVPGDGSNPGGGGSGDGSPPPTWTTTTAPATTSSTAPILAGTPTTFPRGSYSGPINSGGSGGQTTTTSSPYRTNPNPTVATPTSAPRTSPQAPGPTTSAAPTSSTTAYTPTTGWVPNRTGSTPTNQAPPSLPPAAPVTNGSWSVTSITPNTCPINTRCSIVITGSFPETPNVWIGSQIVSSSAVSGTSTVLRLNVPQRTTTGIFTIRLRTSTVDVVIPDSFAYYSVGAVLPSAGRSNEGPDQGPVGGTLPTTTQPPAGSSGGSSGGSGGTAAPTTTTTTPMTTVSVAPPSAPPATAPPLTRRRTLPSAGASFTRNGLTVAVLSGPSPLGTTDLSRTVCRATTCSGRRVSA